MHVPLRKLPPLPAYTLPPLFWVAGCHLLLSLGSPHSVKLNSRRMGKEEEAGESLLLADQGDLTPGETGILARRCFSCLSTTQRTDSLEPEEKPIVWWVFCFSGPHPWHMEVPMRGVESALQPLAYTTATATQDPSLICDLHHSSLQHWILNPLIEARDRTHNLTVPSQIRFHCTTKGTPSLYLVMET